MKVELLQSRVHALEGAQSRGDVIEVDTEEGVRMIAAEQAVLVREKPKQKAVKRGKTEKTIK